MRVSRNEMFFYTSLIGIYILLIGITLSLTSCGGSNLKNPVSESEQATTIGEGETTDDIVELTQNTVKKQYQSKSPILTYKLLLRRKRCNRVRR